MSLLILVMSVTRSLRRLTACSGCNDAWRTEMSVLQFGVSRQRHGRSYKEIKIVGPLGVIIGHDIDAIQALNKK